MALVVEDGTGLSNAESYAATATIDAYWAARPQNKLAAAWGAAVTANKDGAAREATQFLDARFGAKYRGTRLTAAQALLWPRKAGVDDDGNPLPVLDGDGLELLALPPQLVTAVAEVAVRALSGALTPDASASGTIRQKKVGDVTISYQDSGDTRSPAIERAIGMLDQIMRPLLGADGGWPWL